MVPEYGPFRERLEEYMLERTASHPSVASSVKAWHPISWMAEILQSYPLVEFEDGHLARVDMGMKWEKGLDV